LQPAEHHEITNYVQKLERGKKIPRVKELPRVKEV